MTPTRSHCMENHAFRNLSRMEICRRMSVICQKSADETLPGEHHQRLQDVSDSFRDEADALSDLADKAASELLDAATVKPVLI